MDTPSPTKVHCISITSPQTCIINWSCRGLKRPPCTHTVSPLFFKRLGNSKLSLQLCLSNHNNQRQLKLHPLIPADVDKLLGLIVDTTLVYRYGDNQSKVFDKMLVRASGDFIVFDVLSDILILLTNGDPFSIEVQLNLQPAVALPSLTAEPLDELLPVASTCIKLSWEIHDVRKKANTTSPIFTFAFESINYEVQFVMDTDDECIQLQLLPLNASTDQLAKVIGNVTLYFQIFNLATTFKADNVTVQEVAADRIWLTNLELSFADMTDNHRNDLTLMVHLNMMTALQKSTTKQHSLHIHVHRQPLEFQWDVDVFNFNPEQKSSKWFPIPSSDKSLVNVQLVMGHRPNEPIEIYLATTLAANKRNLVASVHKATLWFTDANGLQTKYRRVLPLLKDHNIYLPMPECKLTFAELSNNNSRSFRVLFRMHALQLDMFGSVFARNPHACHLVRGLNSLLVDQDDCDVQLDCQGTHIGAHRLILQMRSSFFRDLLHNNDDQSLFQFNSVDAETMADVLQYIYTDTAPRIAITAERLLSVANLMKLPELHERALLQLMHKQPAFLRLWPRQSFVKLFNMLENDRLTQRVGAFIRAHLDDFLTNSHFEAELQLRPAVCYKLIASIHATGRVQ